MEKSKRTGNWKYSDLDNLLGAEKNINGFINDHMLDGDGLLLSHLRKDTLKVWTREQVDSPDVETAIMCNKNRNVTDHLAYEDSLMAMGEYASAQMTKFRVTGDRQAFKVASEMIKAIMAVYREGSKYEAGYLPKPHGGLKKAAYSHEISPDQYIKCVVALWDWRQYAAPEEKQEIEDAMVEMADYFRNRNYMHNYRDRTIVSKDSRPHCISLYVPILVLAGNLTGEKKYHDDLAQFNGVIDSLETGEFQVNFNVCSLYLEGFHLALQEGWNDPRLPVIIKRQWDANLETVLENGYGMDKPYPPAITSRDLRMPSFANIVDTYSPGTEAYKTGIFILHKITDPTKMTGAEFNPEDLPPGLPKSQLGFLNLKAMSICETSISSWLMGYWRLREAAEK